MDNKQEKTSALLVRTADELTGEKIHIGLLLYRLRRRSFGGLLLFLSFICLIPGVGIFAGILVVTLAAQLLFNLRYPSFPRFISEYGLNVEHLKQLIAKVIPFILKLEVYVKPRMSFLTRSPITSFLGFLIILLAIFVIIPLPFTNFLPAFAIFIIALGLLERDGLLVVVGSAIGLIALVFAMFVILFTIKGVEKII